jgi:hypothetical protein
MSLRLKESADIERGQEAPGLGESHLNGGKTT